MRGGHCPLLAARFGLQNVTKPAKSGTPQPKTLPFGYPRGYSRRQRSPPPGKEAGLPKGNNMCRPVKCRNCGKTTWAGCGEHVDQVKASVPAGQWCTCTRENSASSSSSGGFLAGLFGRK